MREANSKLSAEQERTFKAYSELAESGAGALLELGADPLRLEEAMGVAAAYEGMAAVAGAAPRLRAMREYLDATGLSAGDGRADNENDSARERAIAAVETECQLLKAAVAPAALIRGCEEPRRDRRAFP